MKMNRGGLGENENEAVKLKSKKRGGWLEVVEQQLKARGIINNG